MARAASKKGPPERVAEAPARTEVASSFGAALEIPQPTMREQYEIIRWIETAFTWLDRVAAEHANASRLLPKLDQAILAKAFRGELVPQDANDEPMQVEHVAVAQNDARNERSSKKRAVSSR